MREGHQYVDQAAELALLGVVRHHRPLSLPSHPLLHRTLAGPRSLAILPTIRARQGCRADGAPRGPSSRTSAPCGLALPMQSWVRELSLPRHHLSKVRADAGVAGPMSAKRLVETVTRRRDITEQPAERYELRRRRPFNLPMSARAHRHTRWIEWRPMSTHHWVDGSRGPSESGRRSLPSRAASDAD